jgi:hypothetical protein
MDKYREALEYIKPRLKDYLTYQEDNSDMKYGNKVVRDYDAIQALQELVDRRTPMKPVGKVTDFKCGHCETRVRSGKGSSSRVKDTVCRNCYQVIDWE